MATKKDSSSARLMSLQQVAQALDRDRNTVSKWISQGCPTVTQANADTGQAWQLDLAAVVRWLEERAAGAAAERLAPGTPEGAVTIEEAKRRKAVAEAVVAEIEAAEVLRTVVRWSTVADRVASDYAEVRARLSPLGDQISARLPRNSGAAAKPIVDEMVRNALASLRTDGELKSSR